MRHLATIQKIEEVQPIENADSIEKVRVKNWWCVTQKSNNLKPGDLVVYFEIDSLLPVNNPLFEFMSKGTKPKTMNIDGVEHVGYRLKTIKLRGQLSQGLVIPFKEVFQNPFDANDGDDVSDRLNIVKYEAPIPAHLAGEVKGQFPYFLPKTDEERIQNCGDILEKHKNEMFYVTEKLDGLSASFYKKDGVFGVCSRNLELKENETNTLWRIARNLELEQKLPDNYAIQGEIIGEGIQKNPYKQKGQNLYVFNVYNINETRYLDYADFFVFCNERDLKTVPIIDANMILNNTVDSLLEMSKGNSLLSPDSKREGLVFRPLIETKDEINGSISRLSFKVISNDYLLSEE